MGGHGVVVGAAVATIALSIAVGCGDASEEGSQTRSENAAGTQTGAASTGTAASAGLELVPVVFRAPFDKAEVASRAVYDLDITYLLVNYRVIRTFCFPAQRARDRFGHPGWLRAYCTITLGGKTGDECHGPNDFPVRCPGTINQIDVWGDAGLLDTGARIARFKVNLRHTRSGEVTASNRQLPPHAARLRPPPR